MQILLPMLCLMDLTAAISINIL